MVWLSWSCKSQILYMYAHYCVRNVSNLICICENLVDFNEAGGDLETSYACVNFFRLSIAPVHGMQHLSEVVFSALVGIFIVRKMAERFGFRVVPVHPGLVISAYGDHEIEVTVCGVQHVQYLMACFSSF